MMYPKLLFITINGWNNTTGTATIPSIIDGYPKECVANIFVRPDIPNSPVCDRYFQISEFDVIRSIYDKYTLPGRIIHKEKDSESLCLNSELQKHKKIKNVRVPFYSYIRDIIWHLGNWKNENLKRFIRDYDPDVIVFPAEGTISFLNLVNFIIELTGKPYVIFFWDDNFTFRSKGVSLYRVFLRRKIRALAQNSTASFAITPKMCNECKQYLNIEPKMLTRPVTVSDFKKNANCKGRTINILYTGSLYIDRHKTIKLLIDVIKEINGKERKFHLDIYTNSILSNSDKKRFNIAEICTIHPSVSKEKVIELQSKADILLFVEALKGKYKNAARLSFSTKITDYFAAGKCILAIGPTDIAPIEYLKYRDAALIADSYKSIKYHLENILVHPEIVLEYGKKAYDCGILYHSKEKTLATFTQTILNITETAGK